MKKLLLAVLVGTFCLSATNVLAQTFTGSELNPTQEEIILLKLENATLRAQLQGNALPSLPTLKPYYHTLKIQQQCEAFDKVIGHGGDRNFNIEQYMNEQYTRYGRKVIAAELTVYRTSSGIFTGSEPRLSYSINITIANPAKSIAYNKTYTKWIPDDSSNK